MENERLQICVSGAASGQYLYNSNLGLLEVRARFSQQRSVVFIFLAIVIVHTFGQTLIKISKNILLFLAGTSKGGKSTLDEITNKVFEELLQGKPPDGPHGSDQGSVKVSFLFSLCEFVA